MHLLGRSNRWLPAGLDKRLPHLAVEPGEEPVPAAAGAPAGLPGAGSVVHGFVRTDEGEPVPDAVLTLVSPGGGRIDRVESLADGSSILSAPASGAYLPAATAGVHDPWVRHIMIGDDPLVHDVTLTDLGVTR
ncbi:carboxypeptidase-like regulatory domain-containing protein [Streptomyces sp. NPDC058572]|uniref:carboxypeptidase-like regulatory domain-containing protein n=1 Tax=Streptomyces sp. NPDC058572 TaxID=3346546 RepID=UPI00364DFBAA